MALRPPSTLLRGAKTSADSKATFRMASAVFCTVVNSGVLCGVSVLLGVVAGPAMEGFGSCGTGWGVGGGVSSLLGAVAGPAMEPTVEEDSDADDLVRSRS